MSGHTPGNWIAIDYDQYVTAHQQPHRNGICEMLYTDEPGLNAEVAANGRLIAAAPRLLSAAESTLSRIETLLSHPEPEIIMDDFLTGAAEYLRQAIAAATGEWKS